MNIILTIFLIISIFAVIAYLSLQDNKQDFKWNEKQVLELKNFLNENFGDTEIDISTLENKIKDNFSYDNFMLRINRIDSVKEDKSSTLRLNDEDIEFLYKFGQIIDSIQNQPIKAQDYVNILQLDMSIQRNKCIVGNIQGQTKYGLATFSILEGLAEKGFYNDNKIIQDLTAFINSFAEKCSS